MNLSQLGNLGGVNVKKRIMDFLEERFFGPVLGADESQYKPEDQATLREVKAEVTQEKDRIQNQEDPKQVIEHVQQYAQSEQGRGLDQKLGKLNLPTISSLKEQFGGMIGKLGLA